MFSEVLPEYVGLMFDNFQDRMFERRVGERVDNGQHDNPVILCRSRADHLKLVA